MADEKNVAKKSSSIVDRMSGAEKTNRSPSVIIRSVTLFRSAPPVLTPRMLASAPITNPKESALAT